MKFDYVDFKKKACTFSFDDGVWQDVRLIGIFNKYGLKGTFNLNLGYFDQIGILFRDNKEVPFNKVRSIDVHKTYEGHEVAMHAVTHQNSTKKINGMKWNSFVN